METISPDQKTKSYWEEYFKRHGVRPEQGAKFWQKQEQCLWRTKFPIHESADRWIARTTEEERLPPRTAWKPYGRTPAEKIASAQYAYSQLDEYPPDQQEDICAYLRQHASLQHAG